LFKILKNFFHDSGDTQIKIFSDLHLLCGIMIEAANIDGKIDQSEVNKISKVLINVFNENPADVESELNQCLDEIDQNKSLHFFTSKINQSFSSDKKITLIEILWEIILEDGEVHDFETNLIRRLAGLLYISDSQCGIAKKKALDKL
jgi:uncharacterized tellurite resistance protein B-like protein